ncbi:NAD(P)H-dependent oxidoreductase [Phyllobacterium zundukense]|uniref:NAD(P)H dehydrogenase n=1 Tax=Phyllobacterium zundukense TaxID=1867719 RepID=A0A2N9VQD9_9HYPH|nr:NAD(P)H-dependent oxidoreductase [Phyllobacterium zundukense]ATU90688.1 NAD(P)H dehydrogenase [Phyllobacterium zundukense]PIO41707.1 NAD(P)H dehydrogenase [Phyllobacterium zundukense]
MGKRFVVVLAHPLKDSLCAHLTALTASLIGEAGHDLQILDLYERDFDPRLSSNERRSYYATEHDSTAIAEYADLLQTADVLVLIFPTWWFGLPAILKGWIDRVFAPGIAYDHAPDFGRMVPRLTKLQSCLAITTLGSPWWIDWLIMFRPVRRILSRAIIGTCAPTARFSMLSLYNTEKISIGRLAAFERMLTQKLQKLI